MYNIHPSLLSSYHLYLTQDWMDTDRLINDIKTSNQRTDEDQTEEMKKGTAFHKILEKPNKYYHGLFYRADGFRFSESIKEYIDKIEPKSLKEISSTKIINTRQGKVALDGTIDSIHGIIIDDYKTTKQYKIGYYLDSPQWKSYLLIFYAIKFVYKIFVLADNKKDSTIYVKNYHELPLYAYNNMESDLVDLSGQLIDFCKLKNLEMFLYE